MRNKKNYENLIDSICATVLLFVCLAIYLWFGVTDGKEGTNRVFSWIVMSVIFGSPIIILSVLIPKYCYGYWILLEDSIISKKLFSKRKEIKLAEIKKVERKKASVFSTTGLCDREAYVIDSGDITITLCMEEKKDYSDLEYELAKFDNKNGE